MAAMALWFNNGDDSVDANKRCVIGAVVAYLPENGGSQTWEDWGYEITCENIKEQKSLKVYLINDVFDSELTNKWDFFYD